MESFTCEKCNGLGYKEVTIEPIEITSFGSTYKQFMPGLVESGECCEVCKGEGKIDWVTKMRKGI